jgi:hypothetical protein
MVKEKISKKKPIIGKKKITKCKKKENTKICNICYIEKNNKFVNCIKCQNNYCQKCWINNYKLCSRINGDCLNRDCNFLLNRRFIFNNFNKSFFNYWKNNEINKIISFEKILVEQERRRRDNNSEKNKLLQFKCPDERCNGLFYKDYYNCTICKKLICQKCHKFNDDNHTCESNDIKNINEVLKDITQCPSCKEIIHKIGGCNDMFCTKCNTYFNFITRKETGYRHNPHIENIDSINNENEINFLKNQINENINNELKKKLNNFDFVNNQFLNNYKEIFINSSNDQNITSSSSNYQNVIDSIDLPGFRNLQRTLLNHSTNGSNQNTTSSNNLNNQNAMSLINNQNTTSSRSSINQNTTSSNNLNNQNVMSLINNQQINRHNNTSLIETILNGMNLFNNQQNNRGNNTLMTHIDNVLRLHDENINDLKEFNNYQDIYIFEKRYIYYKSNNIILVIDLELNIFKKVYKLKDLESFSLLYVNNDKIILKNKDNLYFINNDNEDKLIVKSNSFLLKEDNLSPICIKLLIDLNKETGKIIYLSIENSIVEYNLNESKIYNKWDLPTEHLDNCEEIKFIENRELFIFNMKNNLQIFKIQPDSKLVFKKVIISNNNKIIKSNFVNTKYIIGINKNIGYYFKTEHNIIDLDKLEVVKKIDTFDSSNLNDIYFENENIYYFYSKNFLKKIKFYKVDIKKEIESINNCTESIDILESSGINRINFRCVYVYKFIPELKILITIPFPKKNFFTLPYICKFNKINESIKNIQILEKNLRKIIRIMNTYELNTNDIHVFNSNIRTKYLNNRIDEKRFENNIKKKINEFQKKKDINNILNSMKVSFKSILEKYKNRYLENNEDFKKEFQNLEKIVNKDFETHSKIYSCTKFVLNLFSENLDNVLKRD